MAARRRCTMPPLMRIPGTPIFVALTFFASVAAANAAEPLPREPFSIVSDRLALAPFTRGGMQLAGSRDQFLVVWTDGRSRSSVRRWATRIGRDGRVITATGFPLGSVEQQGGPTGIASDGTDFLLLERAETLRVVPVAADGTIGQVADLGYDSYTAQVVWLGNVYAVIFRGGPDRTSPNANGSFAVRIVFIDRQGRQLMPARDLLRSPGGIVTFRVVVSRAHLFLVWHDLADNAIHSTAYPLEDLNQGSFEMPPVITPKPREPYPWDTPTLLSAATNGESAVILWSVRPSISAPSPAYRTRKVDPGPLANPPTTLVITPVVENVRLVWSGTEYLLFSGDRGITLARLDSEGRGIEYGRNVSPLFREFVVESRDGVTVLLTYDYGDGQIRASVLGDGPILDDATVILTPSVPHRSQPTAMWRGDHYLAAWTEYSGDPRGRSPYIVAGRFSPSGKPLDGAGMELGSGQSPVIATDGSGAMIATRGSAWFIDAAGKATATKFDEKGSNPTPVAHWNGSQYLVAFNSVNNGLPELRVIRFDRNGVQIDTQRRTIARSWSGTRVGWTGRKYVFVREDVICLIPSTFGCVQEGISVWGLAASPDLSSLGAAFQIADDDSRNVAIGEGPEGVFIAWTWKRYGSPAWLRGYRISVDGAGLDAKNGFHIAADGRASAVHPAPDGWTVSGGQSLWSVSRQGTATAPVVAFPFVPDTARLVLGGPAPLVVYDRPPRDMETMPSIVGRYVLAPRSRSVRSN